MNSKPSLSDWASSVVGIAFVLMGIVILPNDRNVGISTIALFGACSIVSIRTLLRKLRYTRLSVSNIQVAAAVRIRPSRLKIFAFGAGLLLLGGTLIIFSADPPRFIWFSFWLIAAAGLLVLIALAFGILPMEYLEFTPAGLIFARRNWSVLLPWDRLAKVLAGEYSTNPAIFIWLDSPEDLKVTPFSKHNAFVRYVEQCRTWIGPDIVIVATHYDVAAPVLAGAINRYISSLEARSELAATLAVTRDESFKHENG